MSSEQLYNGYFKNVDDETDSITQLHFERHEDCIMVNAWGRCHPDDCEWGLAKLHVLTWSTDENYKAEAFASWDSSYCHFAPDSSGISCTFISTVDHPQITGYRIDLKFVPGQPKRLLEADPLNDYRRMWDGTDPGWKLVQFANPVYVFEFHFDNEGPTRSEFESLKEFIENPMGSDEETWWESLRDCTGCGSSKPIDSDRLKTLHAHQIKNNLNLTVRTIDLDDFVFESPNGNYATWSVHPGDHEEVVDNMLEANVEIVFRTKP